MNKEIAIRLTVFLVGLILAYISYPVENDTKLLTLILSVIMMIVSISLRLLGELVDGVDL